MRKILLLIGILATMAVPANAAKIPEDVQNYIRNAAPKTDFRFDGVITLPDNTVYLPLYPSLFSDIKKLEIKETYPSNKTIEQRPDIIIFNNDFVLLKVLSDGHGHRTVLHQTNPPIQVTTGLLPQDMLVPSGLIIPENIKGIIGNLKIDTKNEDLIKVNNEDSFEDFLSKNEPVISQGIIPQLKNKTVYITTNYSKNIQVLEPAKASPSYSLAQQSIPIDAKAVHNGKFLLVTTYERPFIDVVSVADSRFIKQIEVPSNPEQILLDEENNKAYITSPKASTIFVIDLKLMALTQKIKINGYCEHLILSDNKLIYVDKLKNEVWSIELDNEYRLKDIGKFPNISSIAFADNKLFLTSRTKSRLAVIDYNTLGLLQEFTTVSKPLATVVKNGILYILGSQNNEIQMVSTADLNVTGTIPLSTGGFSSGFHKISGENLYVVTDIKNNQYTILDLNKNKLLKTYTVNIPIKDVIIADSVRLMD